MSSSLCTNSDPQMSHIPSTFDGCSFKLYVALHFGFEHTLLFNILSIISSLGVVRFNTKSTFYPFSASISSNFSACSTVRGNPSNIAPSLQSSWANLFITIGTEISYVTNYPFAI